MKPLMLKKKWGERKKERDGSICMYMILCMHISQITLSISSSVCIYIAVSDRILRCDRLSRVT